MLKEYLARSVTLKELRCLADLAEEEECRFFRDNSHLIKLYRGRLMAAALCQGAALQYLGRGHGVNDFDVHFFYAQNPEKPRLSRKRKRVTKDIGGFRQVPVDFIRTVIRNEEVLEAEAIVCQIRSFLRSQPTSNAKHLAQKAVVGLLPNELFNVTVWPAGN